MARTAAGWTVAAVFLATLALAACDNSVTPPAASAPSTTAAAPTGAPGTTGAAPTGASGTTGPAPTASGCRQQYETWKHGAVTAAFKAELSYIMSKAAAINVSRLTSVVETAGSAAPRLPLPPQCADPAGYYTRLLEKIKTAGDKARSATGLGALLMAEAPLTSLNGIDSKLSAELNRTVGKKF